MGLILGTVVLAVDDYGRGVVQEAVEDGPVKEGRTVFVGLVGGGSGVIVTIPAPYPGMRTKEPI